MSLPANQDKKEAKLAQWIAEQENLCREIITYLLPQQKVEINFEEYLPNDNWGMALYQENDIKQASLAQKRFATSNNLDRWGIKYLTNYTNQPSKILISSYALKVERADTPTGTAGFLPTSAHEAAHVSWQVNHNSSYKPWIEWGHDDIWKKVSQEFLAKIQAKFGRRVEERFKELVEVMEN
jgi:hypothetical protein